MINFYTEGFHEHGLKHSCPTGVCWRNNGIRNSRNLLYYIFYMFRNQEPAYVVLQQESVGIFIFIYLA